MLRLLGAAIATLSLLPSLYATPADLTERASGSVDPLVLKSYHNPVISGFAPDPSCIRVDSQYFCVTSSFSVFPGIPLYTSRDLVQWQQIGNVLSRPEQLPQLAQVNQSTGGIWAATIRHHDEVFYVTTTLVFDGAPQQSPTRWDNLIFNTTNIWANDGNGWSDPVHFIFQGYDTSLFWDDDGAAYVEGSHAWQVFPAIEQFKIDVRTGENLSEPIILWNGTGGLAPEGPHVYKREDAYYLMIAEGGTGLGHMETMAKSLNITGPYTGYAHNPVLTNANTSEYLQTVGHADLFNDTAGNWWAVALATRNATVNYPMGRETILVPVVWEEGQFPVFNGAIPGRAYINMTGPLPPSHPPTLTDSKDPLVGHSQHVVFPSGPDVSLSDLPRQLVYYRYPDFSRFTVSPPGHPNTLQIMGSAENITGNGGIGTSTFITRRQDAVEFTAEVTLEFAPNLSDSVTEDEEAGMTLFLQRAQHFDLGVVVLRNSASGQLEKFIRLRTFSAVSSVDGMTDPFSQPGILPLSENMQKLRLRVQAVNASAYAFSYLDSPNSQSNGWKIVGHGAASEVSGGFTGTLVGMFATGNGHNSTTPAYFSDFTYDPVQNVF
ncbi:glycoside hydrolase family 43 protein [Phanerochaete carnosa HHB-10118-sp]|uniref:Glycoside hydrolase family 43 protein n=1 Tax=Phanerochaete carnosa (strain HHB-10118-sp) TaxID=650164 RepID=K5W9A5_PHACS|nr:glycoside hydrolase family 43 protein [Phanerochaete carnosa HHB-10118-sp]EKM55564.1 glycoside hydrolase family 43 protein [Phanerochaete carnosa HHB-10118-sp]